MEAQNTRRMRDVIANSPSLMTHVTAPSMTPSARKDPSSSLNVNCLFVLVRQSELEAHKQPLFRLGNTLRRG